MSQDVLHDFDSLSRQAQPVAVEQQAVNPVARIGHNRPVGGVPRGVLMTFTGCFAILLGALAAPAFGTAPFPLIFAIFAICFAGYFLPIWRTHVMREATARRPHADVDTGSGRLSAKEAAWQILPLPALLAAFGIFAIVAKAAIFA
ncbi:MULTISPECIES: hypothetical protein [Pacificimonas]|uniref:DUF2269 family protein n=1 Tax=Pacificimonas aurantium TaxID=1250540 RepID=A0ABS7WH83_9SPHN|nr:MULTISPECIES: hypothetical protein [Pacificimonas]MBZ6377738.1 hypothetical protein [Pacificimonas aurantium]